MIALPLLVLQVFNSINSIKKKQEEEETGQFGFVARFKSEALEDSFPSSLNALQSNTSTFFSYPWVFLARDVYFLPPAYHSAVFAHPLDRGSDFHGCCVASLVSVFPRAWVCTGVLEYWSTR